MSDNDRFMKYGYGIFRLAAVLYYAFQLSTSLSIGSYLSNYRYLGHIYIGLIGGIINVKLFNSKINILLLLLALVFIGCYDLKFDYSIIIYLIKTTTGDLFAGKIDSFEWKIGLFFIFGILIPILLYIKIILEYSNPYTIYSKILIYLTIIQFISEYGDHYLESLIFFRHRYSFEIATLLLLYIIKFDDFELHIIQIDLVICLFYRISNFLIIICTSNIISSLDLLLYIHSYFHNLHIIRIKDPKVAMLVLKQSSMKGYLIEKYIAMNAWYPILSLETVDGDLWIIMKKNFNILHKILINNGMDIHKIELITKSIINMDVYNKYAIVDANVIIKLTLEIFILYLFNRKWEDKFNIFIQASWEWRKEIAVKGKGDMNIKLQCIDLLINDLIYNNKLIWNIFNNQWQQSEYYSLILQPFIISPCINICDIFVSFKYYPLATYTIEDAIRRMHPFPILERYIEKDIVFDDNVCIKANTQVIMLTSDFYKFSPNSTWSIFGEGPRSCAGRHIAITLLKSIPQEFINHICFKPELGHLYSGRNNDNNMSIFESFYFIKIIIPMILGYHHNNLK